MNIARFNGNHIGVVDGDRIVDVSAACDVDPGEWPEVGIVRTIKDFAALRPAIEAAVETGKALPLASVRLETPIPWPKNLIALPNNFASHFAEMTKGAFSVPGGSPAESGFFMESPSSLCGPADEILIPDLPGREFHFECELAIVIGKRCENVDAADAGAYVFGYSCLIDVTMRGQEERVMRKSFTSFTPVGPWIATADAVGPADDVELQLSVNGERRQHAFVREMVVGIHETIALCSSVMALEPGDIIASGTMAGVGPLAPGDEVEIAIDRVGPMKLPVRLITSRYRQHESV